VLKGGLFPAIVGLDFLDRTKILIYVASRKFSFGFAPDCSGVISEWNAVDEGDVFATIV
jgi:hypothetical protein